MRFLLTLLIVSLVLNGIQRAMLANESNAKIASEDSLRLANIELSICSLANDSIQKKNKEIMDFRHGSHDLRDSLISKNFNNRLNYGQDKLLKELE